MKQLNTLSLMGMLFVVTHLLFTPAANAGVFTLTQFVEQGAWSVGLEPEVTLTNEGGFGVNAKFTYGLTSLSNVQFGIGPGSGARGFRIGGGYTFDFLPDLDNQVGAGIAFQGYLYKLRGEISDTELSGAPYIHKSFKMNNGTAVDPYLALPLGISLVDGHYYGIAEAVAGSFFKLTPNFAYSLELGINMATKNVAADSYIAGGIVYTH